MQSSTKMWHIPEVLFVNFITWVLTTDNDKVNKDETLHACKFFLKYLEEKEKSEAE